MKKIFFIFSTIMFCGSLFAQNPRPHDTIFDRNPTYYYQFWFDSADIHPHEDIQCNQYLTDVHASGGIGAKYNYTDSTLSVIGVAAVVLAGLPIDYGGFYIIGNELIFSYIADTTFDNWHEYLQLYKPTDTGMVLLDEQSYNLRDTARYMQIRYFDMNNLSDTTVHTTILPVYEVFFEKPYNMTDSFYVAATNYHGIMNRETASYPGYSACGMGWMGLDLINPHCFPQLGKSYSFERGVWHSGYGDGVSFIFPIIDTVQPLKCEAVTGMGVYQDSAAAIVSWSRGENNLGWQVAYGPAGEDPEGYAVVTAASEAYALRDLTSGEEYAVRVRANCFSDTTYSDWSDTLRFTRPTATQGIAPAALAPHVCLSPNPAHGKVSVCSAFALRRITLYDMQGRPALDTDAQGLTATLDISALPKGTYLVGILTAHGHCTQRLVVE